MTTTTPAEPEFFYMVRRTDGEEIGDYSWVNASGPDDWSSVEDYDDEDEPVEYELCKLTVEPVARHTWPARGEVCGAWQGKETPARSWVAVVLPTDGTDQTWPARDATLAHLDTQEAADGYIAALPERFHLHTGSGVTGLVEVERSRLTTEPQGYGGWRESCTRCRHPYRAHPEAATAS